MAKVGELVVEFKADAKNFKRSVARLNKGVKGFGKRAKALGQTEVSLRRVGTAAAAAGAAIGTAAVALTKLTKRGGQVVGVQRAFTNATKDNRGAISRLREQTRGLISDYELMRGLNTAIALGSAKTTGQFGELAKTAIALGRALGIDAGFALDSLNTGIARQSRLFLDNIGIVLSVEDANKQYAAAVGKTVDELTDAEKREAFRTAALKAAREKVDELGDSEIQAADNLSRLSTALSNMRDDLASLVATSPVVAKFFERLQGLARDTRDAFAQIIDPDAIARDLSRIRGLNLEAARGELRAATRGAEALRGTITGRARALGIRAEPEALNIPRLREQVGERLDILGATGERGREFQRLAELSDLLSQLANIEARRQAALRRIVGLRKQETEEVEDTAGIATTTGRTRIRFESEDLFRGRIRSTFKGGSFETEIANAGEDALVTAGDTLKPVARKIGRELMRGFGSGFQDMEDFLKSIAMTVMSGVLGQLTSGLEIFSPSRVFREKVGRPTGLGIAAGIMDTQPAVLRAANTVMGSAVSGATVSPNVSFDFSSFPAARSPFEAARDREWQDFLSESLREIDNQGGP